MSNEDTTSTDREAFRKFLQEASAEVAGWPEWKRNILGRHPVASILPEEGLKDAYQLASAVALYRQATKETKDKTVEVLDHFLKESSRTIKRLIADVHTLRDALDQAHEALRAIGRGYEEAHKVLEGSAAIPSPSSSPPRT